MEYTNIDSIEQANMAKDEQSIGIFFAAFTIQQLFRGEMLQNRFTEPKFLKYFGDIELSASQRVFIKEIINFKNSTQIKDELQSILLECLSPNTRNPRPDLVFLSRIPKDYLVRQIYQRSDEISPRFQFISDYLNLTISQLDFKKLHSQIWPYPVESQILILSKIFTNLAEDGADHKRRTIFQSFSENLSRWKTAMKNNEGILNSPNIIMLSDFVENYNNSESNK